MILVRYSGDITTKARVTRSQFTRRLAENLRDALRAAGLSGRVVPGWNRTVIHDAPPEAVAVLRRVFGVQSLSAAEEVTWSGLEELVRKAAEHFRPAVAGKRYCVRARRVGERRRIPFGSLEVERTLGAALRPGAAAVDLTHPEVTVETEVSPGRAHLFAARVAGEGGLPVGVQGRALALVSGGFDSAVAAWLALKRGIRLDYLFLNLGGRIHEEMVLRVTKVLADRWSYGYHPKLYALDLRPAVEELRERTAPRYLQVLLKRLMYRAAGRLAARLRVPALVTGEAVGQVSSQTLLNLAVIDRAADRLVLRPLVGANKEEILRLARRVGTYELSAQVAEYCALTPAKPATQARLEAVEREEGALRPEPLAEALAHPVRYDLRRLDLEALGRPDLEAAEIPPGATIIDLRPARLYEKGHYPGALHLEYPLALRSFHAFDRSRTYVLYCEGGFKSAHLADEMRRAGFTAYHVRGGLAALEKLARV